MCPPDLDPRWVRRSFERAAATYEGVASLQAEVADRLLERLDWIHLQPQRVADLGSGTGFCSRRLVSRYPRSLLVALDLAAPMLHEARRRRRRFLSRTSYICGDIQALPLATSCVDLAVSNLPLQWCADLPGTFTEITRTMAPGGLLLFSTFGRDTLWELRQSWAEVDQHVHVNDFADMHDVGDAMTAAGLRDVVVDVDRITVHYPGTRELMRELKCMGAHNVNRGRPRGLTGKSRLKHLAAAYEAYRAPEGLPATYEVVYGHGWGRQDLGPVPVPFNYRGAPTA